MPTADAAPYLAALRASHDELVAQAAGLDAAGLRAPSYDDGWSVADVLSHLGSQAEIFELVLAAGIGGGEGPGIDATRPIWDRWNAKTPEEQREASARWNDVFVARVEALTPAEAAGFGVEFFGLPVDLPRLLQMRLGEHAVHRWDIAVALDPTATVAGDAVPLLVDQLALVAARAGRTDAGPFVVRVDTTEPVRTFVVDVGDEVAVRPADGDEQVDGALTMPAEAFLRLVYGRLDPAHAPAVASSGSRGLDDLRATFPGV